MPVVDSEYIVITGQRRKNNINISFRLHVGRESVSLKILWSSEGSFHLSDFTYLERNVDRLIVLPHNYFSPSSEQTKQNTSLAHKSDHLSVVFQ